VVSGQGFRLRQVNVGAQPDTHTHAFTHTHAHTNTRLQNRIWHGIVCPHTHAHTHTHTQCTACMPPKKLVPTVQGSIHIQDQANPFSASWAFFFNTVRCHRQLFDSVHGLSGSSDSLSETTHYLPCCLPAVLTNRGHKGECLPCVLIL
jgi:hypothetical protein